MTTNICPHPSRSICDTRGWWRWSASTRLCLGCGARHTHSLNLGSETESSRSPTQQTTRCEGFTAPIHQGVHASGRSRHFHQSPVQIVRIVLLTGPRFFSRLATHVPFHVPFLSMIRSIFSMIQQNWPIFSTIWSIRPIFGMIRSIFSTIRSSLHIIRPMLQTFHIIRPILPSFHIIWPILQTFHIIQPILQSFHIIRPILPILGNFPPQNRKFHFFLHHLFISFPTIYDMTIFEENPFLTNQMATISHIA